MDKDLIKRELKFEPFMPNIEAYMKFLEEVKRKYTFIMMTCAPKISKYFTDLTSVINEGNSYEFPSNELHKSIINKLIMNDKNCFKQFFLFIKKSYKENEQEIIEKYPQFAKMFQDFSEVVDKDIHKKLVNIDQYMKDLKKHAINEYHELFNFENSIGGDGEGKAKKKKKRVKNKKNDEMPDS